MWKSATNKPLPPTAPDQRISLAVGITHPQTCLVLGARLRAFRKAGFEVTLVCAPGQLARQTASDSGVNLAETPMKRPMHPLADAVSLVRLVCLLRRLRPAMVEFSTPKAGLLGSLAAALCGVPRRIYLLRGLKLETATGWKRRVLVAAEWLACSCAHVVICNSDSLAERALALRLVSESKLRVLGNGSSQGVDMTRFSPGETDVRQRLGIAPEARVIGFVGRLTRDKGVPELMEAFESVLAACPDVRLLLVGWFDVAEDGLDAGLRARIKSHPRVHCTGFVSDPAPHYRAMDLLVLPTLREGFPNAVLEAQATGIPVITTLSTGSRDSVVAEVTGLLIPPEVPEAITEAVLKLLRDPVLRRRMGVAARTWVREHFTDRRVLEMTVQFYRELLDETGAGRSSWTARGRLATAKLSGDRARDSAGWAAMMDQERKNATP